MRVRLAAALTAAVLAVPVVATAAGATPTSVNHTGDKCPTRADPITNHCGGGKG
jgi:hypothetical protein